MMYRVLLGGALAALAGCATPQMVTRDQWLAETVRVYKGRNTEQVIRAAEAVLNSADPGDITFSHTADGFTAKRKWFVTIIVASADGTDTYLFRATETPEGTRAVLSIDTKAQSSNGVPSEGANSAIAAYRLFFNWLDFALGKGTEWITCDDAEAKLGITNAGGAPGICGPGATAQGRNVVRPRPEWTSESNRAPARPVSSRDQLEKRR